MKRDSPDVTISRAYFSELLLNTARLNAYRKLVHRATETSDEYIECSHPDCSAIGVTDSYCEFDDPDKLEGCHTMFRVAACNNMGHEAYGYWRCDRHTKYGPTPDDPVCGYCSDVILEEQHPPPFIVYSCMPDDPDPKLVCTCMNMTYDCPACKTASVIEHPGYVNCPAHPQKSRQYKCPACGV